METKTADPYGTFGGGEQGGPAVEREGLLNRWRLMANFRDVPQQKNNLLRKCAVELLGDLLFIFIGSLSVTAQGGTVAVAFAHGITIAILIAAMGHISGGHFNPAITLGVFISGNIELVSAIFYIISQLVGGFLGAVLVRCVTTDVIYQQLVGGATMPNNSYMDIQTMVAEGIFTYILVSTVLMTAVDTDSNPLAPMAIGLAIFVDILAGGNISGASMNPARSLGPAIGYSLFEGDGGQWKNHYIYWIGPPLGGIIAGLFYKTFLAKEESRILLK